jgi:hypothetical protein
MLLARLNWGTVPDWFTALAFLLAVYGLANERNKDRRRTHLARVGRARRVSIHYDLSGKWKLVEGGRSIVDPKLIYSITNNGEFPVFEVRICEWDGNMPEGIAVQAPELVYRLDSGKSITGEIPWSESEVREEDAPYCHAEVVFEDVEFYRWRYAPLIRAIQEKPLYSPESKPWLRRWYNVRWKWRWRIKNLRDRLHKK